MATVSGKNGKVMISGDQLADITRWTLETTSANPAYASSSTGGFKCRVPGVKDASGTIAFKLDLANPQTDDLEEGSAVTLLLHLDATRHYTMPVVIDAVHLEVDIDRGEIIGGTARFSANGAWTKPSYS